MFVKPKEGLKIPDTARGDYLPPEGREIGNPTDNGFFWHRRLEEGAVVALDEQAAKASLDAAEAKRKTDAVAAEKARRESLTDEERAAEDELALRARKSGETDQQYAERIKALDAKAAGSKTKG